MSDKKAPEFTVLTPAEKSRKYVFANGEVTFNDVVKFAVSERGTHRLELASGSKVIVPSGWLAIVLDVESWTL